MPQQGICALSRHTEKQHTFSDTPRLATRVIPFCAGCAGVATDSRPSLAWKITAFFITPFSELPPNVPVTWAAQKTRAYVTRARPWTIVSHERDTDTHTHHDEVRVSLQGSRLRSRRLRVSE